ncbi:ABC transporter ATP-binding protein [Brevibacillus marinus]|uniref:ABC transporter ATP-binding protein n=1 Tax=Brevibacillus marinus TaxID=2496837 RepID=UPI000F83278F|nr:ABC transporter ATP-binding protein [Brevibacillus marinus]
MSYVEIRDLCFVYFSAKTAVFDNLTFSLSKGEIVGILGESGSGKSTLLRLIAGLETPSAGKIRIADRIVVDEQTFVAPEQRGVGMVFQDYALFPHLTVAQNIAFGLHRLSRAARKARVREMIELVKLAGLEERYPHELSGGQQQRVAVARALAPKPDILLMDEPFSNLDAALKSEIREELRLILKTAGITCLFVSHDQADIEAICDRSIRIGSVMVR